MGISERFGGDQSSVNPSYEELISRITLADEVPSAATIKRAFREGKITEGEMAQLAVKLLEEEEKGNMRLREENRALEEVQGIDGLTGLYNGVNMRPMIGRLIGELNMEENKQERKDKVKFEKVLFIAIDLDNFKALNDTHGHLVGDRALRNLAQRLRKVTKRGDLVFRYGTDTKGDEFILALPITGSGEGEIKKIFETKEAEINSGLSVTLDDGSQVSMSVSGGYTVVRKGEIMEINDNAIEEVIKKADADLGAKKKKNGKGRGSGEKPVE